MSAPTISAADRVKASRLRARQQTKKPLTPEQQKWLADYEQRSVRATIAAAKKAGSPIATAAAPLEKTVRGPQLTLDKTGTAPSGRFVHTTRPMTASATPGDADTWIPVAPTVPEGTEQTPGAPPPPVAGTPLVDGKEAAQQGGDPATAAKFRKLIVGITLFGVKAWLELATELPVEVQQMLALAEISDADVKDALEIVGASAEEVALRHNWKLPAFTDELVVGVAVAGSMAGLVLNGKRKKARADKAKAMPSGDGEAPAEAPKPQADTPDNLWARRTSGKVGD